MFWGLQKDNCNCGDKTLGWGSVLNCNDFNILKFNHIHFKVLVT